MFNRRKVFHPQLLVGLRLLLGKLCPPTLPGAAGVLRLLTLDFLAVLLSHSSVAYSDIKMRIVGAWTRRP